MRGNNPSGTRWRIGIEAPHRTRSKTPYGVAELTDIAMATSGDYRQFYQTADGAFVSHILDPHVGAPAQSGVASVTVIAPTCMRADAYATALFVMGAEVGLAFVEEHPEIEALFLVRVEERDFQPRFSSGFEKATSWTTPLRSL